MSQSSHEPERLLESLLADDQRGPTEQPAETPESDDDVDALIDALEALVADSRRMPFRKLMIDEDRLLALVDRLRTAVPAEVRQAHRVLDEHDQILDSAREQARRILQERGLIDALEAERRRVLDDAEREAERIRTEADKYARTVLVGLEDQLTKLQTSVRNGIEALGAPADEATR
jgi:vacuolar-type H+-ATPase subunit H